MQSTRAIFPQHLFNRGKWPGSFGRRCSHLQRAFKQSLTPLLLLRRHHVLYQKLNNLGCDRRSFGLSASPDRLVDVLRYVFDV